MKKILLFVALPMCATSAFAQGADECAAAVPLGTGPTTALFDTNVCTDTGVTATSSAEQQCLSLTEDVWFKYVAQTTGLASFDTCNNATFDTEISVWEGSDCSTMIGLGCNDDNFGLGCTSNTSFLDNISVTAGQTYHIQLGFWSTSGGTWGSGTLTIAEFPDPCTAGVDDGLEDNDTCPTAVALGAGVNAGLFVSNTDSDFYRITVPLGDVVDVALSNMVNGDADLVIYDSSCTQTGTAETTGSFANLSGGGPVDVVFEVVMDAGAATNCTNYDLTVTLTQDPCFNGTDDTLEDNDTCSTARTMMAGTNLGLYASLSDADFYRITLAAGEELDFTCSNDLNADVDLNLYDATCGLVQTFNADSLSFSNGNSTTPTTVIVEVFVDPTEANSCTNYDLEILITVNPCSVQVPDAFEDNDDCSSALPLGDGLYPGLNLNQADNDYFAVALDSGATITAEIFFVDATADVDLYLWDPLIDCDTNVAGTGGAYLARGFTTTDDELVTYTNTSGGTLNLVLEVDMFTAGGCNDYSLQIMGAGPGVGPIGTNYCAANPNGTGATGAMSAFGSTAASMNDVVLTASNLPGNQFGIFVVGQIAVFIPNAGGTSNGNICVGGLVGRYNQAGQILSTGTTGSISLPINLGTIPQGNGTAPTMAGDTWFFQAWHRSDVGLNSNFTDGLEISFN